MSHFTCLVIGADYKAALQPFHEFECTGINDQYVQDLNITDDKKAEYAADTETVFIDPEGAQHWLYDRHGNYDIRFCKDEKYSHGIGSHKVMHMPDGWTKAEVPQSTRRTMVQWLEHNGIKQLPDDGVGSEEHKYGYFVADADGNVTKVIDRTNPNRKWDWYTVGGRWKNRLLFKDGSRGDAGLVGDIDWDGMLAEKTAAAAALFDRVTSVIAGRPVESWAQVRDRRVANDLSWDWARDHYNGQQVVKDLVAAKAIDEWDGEEDLNGVIAATDRDSYIAQHARINSSFWSMLHEGRWNERGAMGWWGTSSATLDSTADYSVNFWETIRMLPADETVTVVDCHI